MSNKIRTGRDRRQRSVPLTDTEGVVGWATAITQVAASSTIALATPIFAMAFMVHIHKRLTVKRVTLIEPAR